jgi:hypothetical protein
MARVRRRTWFSTPLVLVLGCGHPKDPGPPKPVGEQSFADATPVVQVDVGIVEADAGPVVVEPDRGSAFPCRGHCNPPGQPTIIDSGKVVDFERKGDRFEIEVVLNDGIDPNQITTQWTAVLTLARHPMPNRDVTILGSTGHSVKGTVAGTIEHIERYSVRFYPPGMRP